MSNKDKATQPQYRAPALEKGLEVLELLANQVEGLTQAQIAQRLDRSSDSLFRIFVCLEEKGFLYRKRPGDTYHLTSRLFTLAHQHPPTRKLTDVAIPVMQELSRSTAQSCHLSIPMPEGMLVVAQIDAPTTIGFSVRKGRTLDMMTSSSGILYRAFACETQQYPAPNEKVRLLEQAYLEQKSVTVEGITDLATPVMGADGQVTGVLCIPHLQFLRDAVPPQDILPALIRSGNEISDALNQTLPESTHSV